MTAEDAGRLLTLVAPGYFAHAAYSARFPQRKRDELPLLIASIAASLPLVAVANALSDAVGIARSPTALLYVAILIGCSLGAGYLFARVRDTKAVRGILTRYVQLGEPETAVALRVLPRLPKKHLVTVFFKDGHRLSGSVRFGGDQSDTAVRELFLVYIAWWDGATQQWEKPRQRQGGVLVNLDEVQAIEVSHDPR